MVGMPAAMAADMVVLVVVVVAVQMAVGGGGGRQSAGLASSPIYRQYRWTRVDKVVKVVHMGLDLELALALVGEAAVIHTTKAEEAVRMAAAVAVSVKVVVMAVIALSETLDCSEAPSIEWDLAETPDCCRQRSTELDLAATLDYCPQQLIELELAAAAAAAVLIGSRAASVAVIRETVREEVARINMVAA